MSNFTCKGMNPLRYFVLVGVLLSLVCSAARAADPKELVFVFQKQKDPTSIKAHADKLAELLSAELKMPVKTQVPGDYSASVQALVSRQADVAYVSSIPFLQIGRASWRETV